MTHKLIASHIAKNTFLPVYLLYGEEEYLVEQNATALKQAALGDGDPSFNYHVFRGSDHKAEEIVAAAIEFPFMSERRVILVRDADPLLKKPSLGKYVQNPATETVLLLCAGSLKPGRARKRPAKDGSIDIPAWLQQQDRSSSPVGAAVEFKAFKDNVAQKWIAQSFADAGKKISPEAVTVMHALCGNGARELASEIEKLLTARKDAESIEADDIYNLLGASRQYNVFELTNAVLERNPRKAQEILHHLLGTEEPVMIVNVLSRQLTQLWRVRSLQLHGRCTDEQARSVGLVWGWQVENIRKYVKNFPDPAYFERCFEYILETDLSIKSLPDNSQIAVTRLVSELTHS